MRCVVTGLVALLLWCGGASAATVFRSVDENGVVTFSDTPPEGDQPVETLQVDTPPPQDPDAYQARLEDMRETTDRMAADRMARERHRAELREIEARSSAYQAPPAAVYDDYVSYLPVRSSRSYWRRHHPPWRPGLRPGPEHPIARPPLRAGYPGLDANDQLMRPAVSSRDNGAGSSNAQLMRPILRRQ